MNPFERFKKLNTVGNLWIYILFLGRNKEIIKSDVRKLVFEKFEFLPGRILTSRVINRLQSQDYISSEKFQGKKAYKTTEEGIKELEKMKAFVKELKEKIQ